MGISMPRPRRNAFDDLLGLAQIGQAGTGLYAGIQDIQRKSAEQDRLDAERDGSSDVSKRVVAMARSAGVDVADGTSKADLESAAGKELFALAGRKTLAQSKAQHGMPKQNEFAAANFSKMAQSAGDSFERLTSKGLDPTSLGTFAQSSLLKGPLEYFKGQDVKGLEQAQRQFVQAVLRKESGATITPDEFSTNAAKYFPQPGDGPDVLAQKAQARAQAVAGLTAEGGRANDRVASQGYQAPAGGGVKSGGVPGAVAGGGPKVGTLEDGHMFVGGDPSNPNSWKKVK